ncbi:MAG TPA: acyl carrier protein [Burkholderiales bacterium]|nr:acyl carrier protein [Burkholderiales bacterium]
MSIASEREREQRIQELIVRVLRIDAPVVALVRSEIPEWDSLKHMELVFALEDEFGVRFDEAEFAALVSPGEIANIIKEHLAS